MPPFKPRRKKVSANKENEPINETTTTERCFWTSEEDAVMLATMKKKKLAGLQSDSGWKGVVWTAVVEDLQKLGVTKGAPKTAAKVSDHFSNLKSNFVEVRKVRGLSGFGWDDTLKLAIATDDTWEALIKSHPKLAKWRKTPFPFYDEMAFLVDGVIATGAGAFHAGGTLQDSPEPSDASSAPGTPFEDGAPTEADSPSPASSQIFDNHDGESALQVSITSASEVSTPAKASVTPKRQLSIDATDAGLNRSVKKPRQRKRNAVAVSEVADAVRHLADVWAEEGKASLPDAARQQAAIRLLEDDGYLSEDERLNVLEIFTDKPNVANSFLAISDKRTRTLFAHRQVAKEKF